MRHDVETTRASDHGRRLCWYSITILCFRQEVFRLQNSSKAHLLNSGEVVHHAIGQLERWVLPAQVVSCLVCLRVPKSSTVHIVCASLVGAAITDERCHLPINKSPLRFQNNMAANKEMIIQRPRSLEIGINSRHMKY